MGTISSIIIEIGQRGDGIDTADAEWNGRTLSAEARSSVLSALARLLVSAGAPDGAWRATRGGRVVMYGPSLHGLASRTLYEDDTGFHVGRWRPHPQSQRSPALEQAVAKVHTRVANRDNTGASKLKTTLHNSKPGQPAPSHPTDQVLRPSGIPPADRLGVPQVGQDEHEPPEAPEAA